MAWAAVELPVRAKTQAAARRMTAANTRLWRRGNITPCETQASAIVNASSSLIYSMQSMGDKFIRKMQDE